MSSVFEGLRHSRDTGGHSLQQAGHARWNCVIIDLQVTRIGVNVETLGPRGGSAREPNLELCVAMLVGFPT